MEWEMTAAGQQSLGKEGEERTKGLLSLACLLGKDLANKQALLLSPQD